MRLGPYIIAEVSLATVALGGAGLALEQTVSDILVGIAHASQYHPASARLEPRLDETVFPEVSLSTAATGTFLGMSDELLLARMRTQTVTRVKANRGGSSISFRIDFADGSRAAFKPAQTNLQTVPRKEVAAYRLNRLLGLNAVAPAAPRVLTREEIFGHLQPDSLEVLPRLQAQIIFNPAGQTAGEMAYWIPQIKDSGLDSREGLDEGLRWLTQGQPIPNGQLPVAAQFSDLIAFDFLTANPDRHSGGNMKMSPDGSRLYFMDNTMSFFLEGEGIEKTRLLVQKTQRFSRRLVRGLDGITESGLSAALAGEPSQPYEILTQAEIRAVVARQRALRRHLHDLVAQYGEENVLVFP